ncbi:nucleotidyltransferase domain-containing protein [Candidatus Accumulibacter vicinus]|uniref:Putative nucleotidyltransferase n=1 Tax=Candidatus Accumulibacter vicinus TaxID=2954382 RepID=A0A084Y0F9_9PROT|nr:nucleotidyltransferase domain-containing protein [Candidatus Accumulibacter vicinus]KFB68203.1 MAG: putative nucleotidyltransferase [Candidatus Accumulibacter vicinus]
MIPTPVRAEIISRIQRAESEHSVRVLLAVESGSRAWGFESPNSDYDARFIYAHQPDWYLSVNLEDMRDVIEYPIVDDIDLNGWDVRKALRLFARSNPAFVEWIQSPIVYLERGSFAARVRHLLPSVYSCVRGVHHYRSMAKTNYRGYLRADLVPLKKYFYVLRPLLSVRWLEKYGNPAPIEFERLLHLVGDQHALLDDINRLLERKRAAPEMGLQPPVRSIHAFIEQELERLENVQIHASSPSVVGSLNEVFRTVLRE